MAFHRLTYLALVGLVPTLVLSQSSSSPEPTTITATTTTDTTSTTLTTSSTTHQVCAHLQNPLLLTNLNLKACDEITHVQLDRNTDGDGLNTVLNNKIVVRVPRNANLLTVKRDVQIIPQSAFSKMGNLQTVEFEQRGILETIGQYAFADAKSLSYMELPSTVTEIGVGAFFGCLSLSEINLPFSITAIASEVFASSGLLTINIPQGITSIGQYAFNDCSSLARVTFDEGSSLESIDQYAFSRCTGLNYVKIPDNVSLGVRSFDRTLSLDTIKIPAGVTLSDATVFENSECHDITLYQPGNTLIHCELTSEDFEVPSHQESEDDSDDVPTWSIIVMSVLGGIVFLMAVGFVLMRRRAIYNQLTTRAEF